MPAIEPFMKAIAPIKQVELTLQDLQMKVENLASMGVEELRDAGSRGSREVRTKRNQSFWQKTFSAPEKDFAWDLNCKIRVDGHHRNFYLFADGSVAIQSLGYGQYGTYPKEHYGVPLLEPCPVNKLPDILSCEQLAKAIKNLAVEGGAMNDNLLQLHLEITGT